MPMIVGRRRWIALIYIRKLAPLCFAVMPSTCPLFLAFKRCHTRIRSVVALLPSQISVRVEAMSKFLSFRRNARPPSPDDRIQSDDNLPASGLTDIKDINAHALDETSTLENEGGAAVEIITPLGRNLGWTSAFFINVPFLGTVQITYF